MIEATLERFKTLILREKVIKVRGQAEAIRIWNYPYQAIEEAVVNAFYHRDYLSYEPVTIEIEPDCSNIIIFSGIDRSISNKSIEEGKRFVSRYYRNRRLGDFLKELDLSEGHSTGVPTIQGELEKNGSPKAIFHTDEDRRAMRIQIPIHPAFLNEKGPFNVNDVEKGKNLKNSFQNERSLKEVLKEVLSKSDLKKTSAIVEYLIKNGEITPKMAEKITEKSPATAWRYLKILVDAGVVESEGGTNNLIYKLKKKYQK